MVAVKLPVLHKNMRQREALRAASGMGAVLRLNSVTDIHVSHPLMEEPCSFSRHRMDVTQQFVVWLRRLRGKLGAL